MNRIFYTYIHRRDDTGEVFYVGKGKGNRAWVATKRNAYWHNIVAKHGYSVEVVAMGLTEADAYRQEKRLIKLYSREHLANLSDGGEGQSGYVPTPEHRKKVSDALKGRQLTPMTDATREKIRAANAGKPVSAERRAKQAAAQRGWKRPKSAEQRAKISAAKKGQRAGISTGPCSEETKAKLRAANLGKKQSAEAIAKRVATQVGRKASEEARANMRRAQQKLAERRRLEKVRV